MRKLILLATSALFVVALSGCVTQVTHSSNPSMSASDTSSSAASQSSSQSQSSSASAANWTTTLTAAEAAKGAGISSFNAPTRTVIADYVFTNPQFAYTEHMAQATYEVTGAAKLIVRKAEGAHTASITDLEQSSFSQSWRNTYEGFEVMSYGNTQGAAAICVWNDGTKEYGVTIESLGSATVTMDAEDIDDIVKAVKAAESASSTATQQTSQSTSAQQSSTSAGPGFDLSAIVQKNGLGAFLRYYYVTDASGKGYWAVVTRGADGGEYTSYVDASGNVVQGGVTHSYDGADFNVEALVQANGLGQFKRYYWIQGENGQGYWGIVTTAADGSEVTTYTDEQGNIIQGGVEVGSVPTSTNDGADFNVEALVQSNGLGQYERYYWIQGSGNTGYWGIVTRAADGSEVTTYTDEQGNIIQGGL